MLYFGQTSVRPALVFHLPEFVRQLVLVEAEAAVHGSVPRTLDDLASAGARASHEFSAGDFGNAFDGSHGVFPPFSKITYILSQAACVFMTPQLSGISDMANVQPMSWPLIRKSNAALKLVPSSLASDHSM